MLAAQEDFMRRVILAFTIATLLGVSAAGANVHVNATGQVSLDIPSSWKVTDSTKGKTQKGGSSGMLVAQSKDDAVGLIFWVVGKADAKQAIKFLDNALRDKIKDAKWDKAQDANINGMKGIRNGGTATIDGKEAVLMLAIVGPTPTKKGVIVFAAVEKAKLATHKTELGNIFDSLQPVKK